MVIDERVVVAGSFNHTQPANEFNDENLFVIRSVLPRVEKISVNPDRCKALARHMRKEIERIIAGSKQYVP
jgi:phosphatidylserine/phosphatidylglycerophosphate/cardiolipin synthase-like enzyme